MVVKKPWGYEYVIYSNTDVEIKHLFINVNQNTSLHCHPNKKTGLCVVRGLVKVEFLNNHFWLEPGDKLMIRQGVFHKSIAKINSELLEIENPVDKNDLIRLEDSYGREQLGYEDDSIDIEQLEYNFNQINFNNIETIHKYLDINDNIDTGKYFILSGGIYNILGNKKIYVLGPGDLVESSIINKLSNRFHREKIECIYVKSRNI